MPGAVRKGSDGKYRVGNYTYEKLIGSRAEVWHRTAYKTAGDLKHGDLLKNKHGRIVSRLKHDVAKQEKRLEKAGYKTKKGHFGSYHDGKKVKTKKARKSKRKSHKRKSRK